MICTSQKILLQNLRVQDGVARQNYVRKKWVQGLGGNPEGKRPLRRTRDRWENDIKVYLTKHRIALSTLCHWGQGKELGCCTHSNDTSDYIKREKILGSLKNYFAKYYSPVRNDTINYLINGRFKKSTIIITLPFPLTHPRRRLRWHPSLRVQTRPKPLDFYGSKNPQHAFLRRGSKRISPMSQLCGMQKNLVIYVNYGLLAKFQV